MYTHIESPIDVILSLHPFEKLNALAKRAEYDRQVLDQTPYWPLTREAWHQYGIGGCHTYLRIESS